MLSNDIINTFIAVASFLGVLIVFFQNRGVRLKKIDDIDDIERKANDKINKLEEKILSLSKVTNETIKDQSILSANLQKVEAVLDKMADVMHQSQIKQAVTDSKLESMFKAIAEYANKVSRK